MHKSLSNSVHRTNVQKNPGVSYAIHLTIREYVWLKAGFLKT